MFDGTNTTNASTFNTTDAYSDLQFNIFDF